MIDYAVANTTTRQILTIANMVKTLRILFGDSVMLKAK